MIGQSFFRVSVCTITTRLNRWALLQFSKLFSPRPSSHSHPSAQVEVHASFVGSFDTANAYTWFFIPIWHSIADIILSSISCNPTNPLLSSRRLLFFAPSRCPYFLIIRVGWLMLTRYFAPFIDHCCKPGGCDIAFFGLCNHHPWLLTVDRPQSQQRLFIRPNPQRSMFNSQSQLEFLPARPSIILWGYVCSSSTASFASGLHLAAACESRAREQTQGARGRPE